MYIGRIKNFGGRDGMANYGFIETICDPKLDDLFFHISSIDRDSKLLGYAKQRKAYGLLVAYEEDAGSIDDRGRKAKNVKLLREADREQAFLLLKKESRNARIANDVLKKEFRDILFDKDPIEYFKYFKEPDIRNLYFERYQKGYFKDSFLKSASHYVKDAATAAVLDESYINKFDLVKEPEEDAGLFVAAMLKYGNVPQSVIRVFPHSVFEEETIKNISWSQLKDLRNAGTDFFRTYRDTLLKYNDSPKICHAIAVELNFSELKSDYRLLDALQDEELAGKIAGENNLEDKDLLIHLFEFCESQNFIKTRATLSKLLIQQNILNIGLWMCAGPRLKIRIILALSTFLQNLRMHKTQYIEYMLYEKDSGDKIIMAALMFLMIYYDISFERKQERFRSAHEILLNEIINCFNKEIDVKPSLDELLPVCQQPRSFGFRYDYCDGRPWAAQNAVYCPEGMHHVCARKKCLYFKELNYANTSFQRTKDLSELNLTDLFINIGFNPDLSFILTTTNNPNAFAYRYAHLLSGFVNQLIRMRPHMKCRCGEHFTPDFNYAKSFNAKVSPTMYSCVKAKYEPQHDEDVYLNFCLRCHRIVDSRECKIQDESGYWLCMYCGGSKEYGRQINRPKCPACGNERHESIYYENDIICCTVCGHNIGNRSWEMFIPESNPNTTISVNDFILADELPF